MLLSAGDLDTWFGGDGTVTTASPIEEQGTVAALAGDGRLLVAGTRQSAGGDFTVVRLNADGSLDTDFGSGGEDGDGRVTADFFGGGADAARAVAILPGGKILVAGSASRLWGGADFALVRYNADGSPDPTFGRGGPDGDGRVTTDFFGTAADAPGDEARAMAVLPDGKILLAGSARNPATGTDFALARYNADGTLDVTFAPGGADGDGRATTDFGAHDDVRAAAVLPGGKIVAVGYSADAGLNSAQVAIARYNADGSLDVTFGRGGADGDGKVTTRIAAVQRSFGRALAVLPSGRLLVAGQTRDGNGYSVALVRYLPDGTLDTSFGVGDDYGGGVADGFAVTPISGSEDANAVALTADGRIVVGGSSYGGGGGGSSVFAAGYNADGSRDTDFERSGRWYVYVPFGDLHASASAILLRPAGQIVLAGTAAGAPGGAGSIAVVQLQGSAGDRDPDDQISEAVATSVGTSLTGRSIERITDVDLYRFAARAGQRVAFDVDRPAGGALDAYLRLFSSTGAELAASDDDAAPGEARGADPYLEYRFSSDGTYYVGVSAAPNRGYRATTGDFDDLGRTTGGYSLTVGDMTARPPSPGDPDLRFNGSGAVRDLFGAYEGRGSAGAALPDGRVIVAGARGNDFLLARYNADGSLDATFGGGDGFVSTDFAGADPDGSPRPSTAAAEAVAVLPDGRILVAGTANTNTPWGNWYGDIVLARYTADGVLDTTFGRGGREGDGKVMDRPGESTAMTAGAHALAVLPDGKFLIGGEVGGTTAVMRYNADGTLDTAFGGGDGVAAVTEPFGSADYGRASPQSGQGYGLARLPGGGILLTGVLNCYETAEEGPGDWYFSLGTFDRFNADGSIDATFGGGTGRVVHARVSTIGPAVPLADGRVAAAIPYYWGEAASPSYDFAVARFRADGSLDPTFGPAGDGVARLDFFGRDDFARAIAVDSAGNLLVTGTATGESGNGEDQAVALARLLPDGRPDSRFGGGDGAAVTDLGLPAYLNGAGAVFLQPDQGRPDGTAVIVGTASRAPAAMRFINNPPAPEWHEAELASVTGAAVGADHPGFSGTGYIDFSHATGDAVEFTVNAPAAGRYVLAFRYANGSAAARAVALAVDGTPIPGGVPFAPTGSWASWATATVTVSLAAGPNTVRLTAAGQSGPNLDALGVTPAEPAPAGATYEAEQATLAGAVVARNVAGYEGSGFVDFLSPAGGFVEWMIDVPAALYSVEFRYANGSAAARSMRLRLDGQVALDDLTFAPTGRWSDWRVAAWTLPLAAGRHVVRLVATGQSGPNVDWLGVRPRSDLPPTAVTVEAEDATRQGAVFSAAHPGYTGGGFVDFLNTSGDFVEFTFDALRPGQYVLDFRYANGSTAPRAVGLSVNGQAVPGGVTFAPTGSWRTWRSAEVTAVLRAGVNTVRVTATGQSGPNLDSLTVGQAVGAALPAATVMRLFSEAPVESGGRPGAEIG